jgi:hypothetical protein
MQQPKVARRAMGRPPEITTIRHNFGVHAGFKRGYRRSAAISGRVEVVQLQVEA